MSYPTIFATPGVRAFAEAVDTERQAQLAKWGEQHHRDGTGPDQIVIGVMTGSELADFARNSCQHQAEMGIVTWRDILGEEVAEALAESDPAKLRTELIQVAAVCAAWIEAIDRRTTAAAAEPDTCATVEVDGEPIRVHGQHPMSPESQAALAEVVGAARRKHAAEHAEADWQ